jgi:hypothetical protein
MTNAHVAMIFLSLLGCRGRNSADEVDKPEPALACNLNGLSEVERRESRDLLERIGTAVVRVDELSAGYALRIDEARLPLAALSRWVDLERRCCPFFHFDVEVMPNGAGTWLRLTGAAGVKEFIQSELGTTQVPS